MIERIVQCYRQLKIDDRTLLRGLLQEKDQADDYLQGRDTYTWHVAIGRALRPTRIGEIGVRFGYALACLAGGSVGDLDAPPELALFGWDNECYEPGSMTRAAENLTRIAPPPPGSLLIVNTQELEQLECPPLDLIHVDGDHSFGGALHDMALAWAALRDGGVMLVDDYRFIEDVQLAVKQFSIERQAAYGVLPTFRGTAVFAKE